MNPETMRLPLPTDWFQTPALTKTRVRTAYAVAVATDALQFALGPVGWAFADEALDVIAAILTWRLLGFHPLLLPTFVIEALPIADMLPTWTGCVGLVVAMRRREPAPSAPPAGDVIDV